MNQSRMIEHYDYKDRKRWSCLICKTNFESNFHLENHECQGMSRYRGKPRMRLQNLHDEVILCIIEHLNVYELVNFIDALPKIKLIHGLKKLWLEKYPLHKIRSDKRDYQHFCLGEYEEKMDSYTAVTSSGYWYIALHRSVHRYSIHKIIMRASERVVSTYQTRACQHCDSCKQFCLFRKRRFQIERKINECEQRFNCCGSSWDQRRSTNTMEYSKYGRKYSLSNL